MIKSGEKRRKVKTSKKERSRSGERGWAGLVVPERDGMMAEIVVKFFGPAHELAGVGEVSLELKDGETLGGLAGVLAERYPKLGAALGLRLAVNREYAALDRVLCAGDEVAVIPPVSGGAGSQRVLLTREPIEVGEIAAELRDDGVGAVASFVGTVRSDTSDGRRLCGLEYHAYEAMATEQMEAIRERAMAKYDIRDATIVHRLGRLNLGEASIAVVAVAAHRAAAFDACRWMIDAVKIDVPIWKKDIWADGSVSWVEPTR